MRIALANLRFPATREESVQLARQAIAEAAVRGAAILCFPECYVPGYRGPGKSIAPPDPRFLAEAWSSIGDSVKANGVTTVLGTERLVHGELRATALVINADGSFGGFQDKVQIDPSEEGLYMPGTERSVFRVDALTFGIVICHEGWRYPETVRWAVKRGAQIVFHPQFHEAEGDSYRATTYADPANTFHEKAVLCRAAENNCYFATVNYASAGSPTTSAIADPNGALAAYQPYGAEGLLIADLDLNAATRLLAERCRTAP